MNTTQRIDVAALSTPFDTLEIRPLTPQIGGEVSGVDLSQPLSDERQREQRNSAFGRRNPRGCGR